MDRPIGVIDSGVGGLTVAKELMRQLPKEELIYIGDTLRCPYGPRPKEEVMEYTWDMVNYLINQRIKMLVVACNTATAYTLDHLREHLAIPVVGVIQPGARAAIKTTKNSKIGVIGTEGTIQSKAYPNALHHINPDMVVHGLACPPFVPMVEQGLLYGPSAKKVVEEALAPLKRGYEMDTLILGCTHYPLLRDTIQDVMGDEISIISSGDETAREVSVLLEYYQTLYQGQREPEHKFYATGDQYLFEQVTNAWFGDPVATINAVTL